MWKFLFLETKQRKIPHPPKIWLILNQKLHITLLGSLTFCSLVEINWIASKKALYLDKDTHTHTKTLKKKITVPTWVTMTSQYLYYKVALLLWYQYGLLLMVQSRIQDHGQWHGETLKPWLSILQNTSSHYKYISADPLTSLVRRRCYHYTLHIKSSLS